MELAGEWVEGCPWICPPLRSVCRPVCNLVSRVTPACRSFERARGRARKRLPTLVSREHWLLSLAPILHSHRSRRHSARSASSFLVLDDLPVKFRRRRRAPRRLSAFWACASAEVFPRALRGRQQLSDIIPLVPTRTIRSFERREAGRARELSTRVSREHWSRSSRSLASILHFCRSRRRLARSTSSFLVFDGLSTKFRRKRDTQALGHGREGRV